MPNRRAQSLQALNEVSGEAGVSQRGFKQEYLNAARAPASAAAAQQFPAQPLNTGAGQGRLGQATGSGQAGQMAQMMRRSKGVMSGMGGGGGMGGMGGGAMMKFGNKKRSRAEIQTEIARVRDGLARAAADPRILVELEAELREAESPQSNVRQIGAKTFYFKNGRWVDSSVKPEEDAKAVKVVQFSDDYFRIARTQKAEYNQYLSQSDPVTVKLEGTVYHIDPVPQEAKR